MVITPTITCPRIRFFKHALRRTDRTRRLLLHPLEFRFQVKDGPANLANRDLHHEEWPVRSENNNEEAVDCRRDLAENGLNLLDLESRFSALSLKGC